MKTEPPSPPRGSEDHDNKPPLDTKTSARAETRKATRASADAEVSGEVSASDSTPPSAVASADESVAAETGGEPGRKKRKLRHRQTVEAMQEALDKARAELTDTKERLERAEELGSRLLTENQTLSRGRGRGASTSSVPQTEPTLRTETGGAAGGEAKLTRRQPTLSRDAAINKLETALEVHKERDRLRQPELPDSEDLQATVTRVMEVLEAVSPDTRQVVASATGVIQAVYRTLENRINVLEEARADARKDSCASGLLKGCMRVPHSKTTSTWWKVASLPSGKSTIPWKRRVLTSTNGTATDGTACRNEKVFSTKERYIGRPKLFASCCRAYGQPRALRHPWNRCTKHTIAILAKTGA